MIGYITIGTKDLAKAKAFFSALLAPLDANIIMEQDRMVLFGTGLDKPILGICTPYDEKAPHPGNGNMVGIQAGSREKVDQLYAKALELGGTDEGPAGERNAGFYGGYFRDLDGNKFVFYHYG